MSASVSDVRYDGLDRLSTFVCASTKEFVVRGNTKTNKTFFRPKPRRNPNLAMNVLCRGSWHRY